MISRDRKDKISQLYFEKYYYRTIRKILFIGYLVFFVLYQNYPERTENKIVLYSSELYRP